MILSQQEFQDFQKIYGELLFHTGQKFFKSSQSKENFFDLAKPELKIEIRDKLFKEDYISEIIKTNPFHFPDSYIEILKEW
ncbi:MAG: hypothetical protein KDK45_21725, partial [Leptospiraceae bacterium]|nr:hypothetical protein [Leptospiraceae bacterium]